MNFPLPTTFQDGKLFSKGLCWLGIISTWNGASFTLCHKRFPTLENYHLPLPTNTWLYIQQILFELQTDLQSIESIDFSFLKMKFHRRAIGKKCTPTCKSACEVILSFDDTTKNLPQTKGTQLWRSWWVKIKQFPVLKSRWYYQKDHVFSLQTLTSCCYDLNFNDVFLTVKSKLDTG